MNTQPRPPEGQARFHHYLFVALQYLLPQHWLSWLMFKVTRAEWPPLKDFIIRRAIDYFRVDMSQALIKDPAGYRSFNEFFTRPLDADSRPFAGAPDSILCPADGVLSQSGEIVDGRIFQAKGIDFSLLELLGGDTQWADLFEEGRFATVYLSPRDYHRVHMPAGGTLREMIHVPGRLFSVNAVTTRIVPRLFSRNERVVSLFETEHGPMAVILVGAIFVASIDTVWSGTVTPAYRQVRKWKYGKGHQPVILARGDEMGRFNMGSTVILLFGKQTVEWTESLHPGIDLRMGETIGSFIRPNSV